MKYEIVKLRECPERKDEAAVWFHEKWGYPLEAYRESMEECLAGGGGGVWWPRAGAGADWGVRYLGLDEIVLGARSSPYPLLQFLRRLFERLAGGALLSVSTERRQRATRATPWTRTAKGVSRCVSDPFTPPSPLGLECYVAP